MAQYHHHQQSDTINIRIDKKSIERIIYWVIILVLLVLLVISYMSGSGECSPSTNATANVAADTAGSQGSEAAQDNAPIAEPEPEPEEDLLPIPTPIPIQPEPDPEPEPEPEPEPQVTLSGVVKMTVKESGIKIDDLGDNRIKITKIPVEFENGKTFALEGYKVLVYAYGDDEDEAAVRSKERVEKDGFVVPVTPSGETSKLDIDLSAESIFNVVNDVIIKVKLFDDRDKLLDSITVEKRA